MRRHQGAEGKHPTEGMTFATALMDDPADQNMVKIIYTTLGTQSAWCRLKS